MVETLQYRLVLPPGWASIPLDERANAAGRRLVDRAAANAASGSSAQVRSYLTARLREIVQGACQASGLELYLPVELVEGSLMPLSIIVTAPMRHQMISAPGAKLTLQISPMFIALLSIIGSFGSATCAMIYQSSDGSFTWWWVNVVVFAAVTVVAFWHGNRRPCKKRTKRKPPRSR